MGTAETHYVKDGEVLVRPACPATLVGRVLENLPVPCTITIEGVVHDCTDDHCELEFSQPGTYSVRVSSFPWLDASFQVSQV
jgi:hypothetical protein